MKMHFRRNMIKPTKQKMQNASMRIYEHKLNWLINHDAASEKIYDTCVSLVNDFGDRGGVAAYALLLSALRTRNMDEESEENVLDVLDALSGECSVESRIGSGNYNHQHSPA